MLEFRTQGYNGYGVKYSPFYDSRIAAAASANFGLVGNGRLYILNLTAQGILAEKWYDTKDALFDVCWSEAHENQLLVGCGDGSIRLFDLARDQFPIAAWSEHGREVFSVHWNLVAKDTFLSSSWDGTIRVWNPNANTSLLTIPTGSCTYSVQFSPHNPSLLSCVTSESNVQVFDLRTPASADHHCVMRFQNNIAPTGSAVGVPANTVAPAEVLTHDWNKYRPEVLATGGVDRLIRSFDYRNPRVPIAVLPGHEYAVRKLAWSPHLPDVLLSASYDMTCRVWTDGSALGNSGPGIAAKPASDPMAFGGGREIGRMARHSEFATGVDWCLFGNEGWVASCAWDERVLVWDVRAFMA